MYSSITSLSKHGYRPGLSSTEYTLKILEELKNRIGQGEAFHKVFVDLASRVLVERPANAGAINALREIGLTYLNEGVDKAREEVAKWIRDVKQMCKEAALVASHRVTENDTIMTLSNGMCLRYFFSKLAEDGKNVRVYIMESRPGMEGLDLAGFLDKLGFDVYLIVDSAARFFMKDITRVFVGVEAVAINGAIIAKTGTSLLALVANEARVRVFAIAPLYKFSFETILGELLKIPEGGWELLMDNETRKELPREYRARVPLYDVTPPSLIDGLATEHGLFAPQAIPVVLKQVYGAFPIHVEPLESIIEKVKRSG
ncbi:MAG: initiation factor 2B [Thermoprotei archaeon]